MKILVRILIAVYMVASLTGLIFLFYQNQSADLRTYNLDNKVEELKKSIAELDAKTTNPLDEIFGPGKSDLDYLVEIQGELKYLEDDIETIKQQVDEIHYKVIY